MRLKDILSKGINWLRRFIWVLVLIFLMGYSTVPLRDPVEWIRRFTRQDEFEYLGWTLRALTVKFEQFSLDAIAYMPETERSSLVITYFKMLNTFNDLERQLEEVIANPESKGDAPSTIELNENVERLRAELDQLQPIIEGILQQQAAFVISEMGIDLGGHVFPPVAFKFTQLPLALIVSPRDVIRQEANIQLDPNLSLEERIKLEGQVDDALDVSSLVVNIGGIGIYPTMVLESDSITWVVETVVHEWIHNYLTLHPLGLNYDTSPELRTMNETVASILGTEIGGKVLERYYPDFAPKPIAEVAPTSQPSSTEPPAFDFQAEMYQTRVRVDQLLAQGEIEEAEAYMEERRQVFWDHGYHIRKLNQAYFAFYGAYADIPQGPAGKDPVGEAVRELWSKLQSPSDFLRLMSWMNDYSDLKRALDRLATTR
jgi:hypothetical protein